MCEQVGQNLWRMVKEAQVEHWIRIFRVVVMLILLLVGKENLLNYYFILFKGRMLF